MNYKVEQRGKLVGTFGKEALINQIKGMYSNRPAAIYVIDKTPFDELIEGVNADGIFKVTSVK